MLEWQRNIVQWIAQGETGISSETIAFTALGVEPRQKGYPRDPGDLRRCLVLLQQCPVAARALPVLAETSDAWAALVRQWDSLEASLRAEVGDSLSACCWSAPKTYAAMKHAIA